jgi:hypothetical protein
MIARLLVTAMDQRLIPTDMSRWDRPRGTCLLFRLTLWMVDGYSLRYDKLATTFLAFVQFAAVLDWLTHRVLKHSLDYISERKLEMLARP